MQTDMIKRSLSLSSMFLRKHAPEILVGTGLLAGVGATIFACRATLEAQKIIANAKKQIAEMETMYELDETTRCHASSAPPEAAKAITNVYVESTISLAKTYAPAILLTGASVGCILSAFHILKTREAAIICALSAIETAYSKYRESVTEVHGPQEDLRFLERAKELAAEKHIEFALENETVNTDQMDQRRGLNSPYGRWFERGNANWEPDRHFNRRWLEAIQANMNDILRAQGYITLNTVYERLGMPQTPEGQLVGWLHARHKNNDGFVDFGLDSRLQLAEYFQRDATDFYLDFNVDGIMYDYIGLTK